MATKKRGFITYKSYLFRSKDPIIDALRTAKQDAGMSYKEMHEKSGVSVGTFSGWFDGNVKRPQFGTVSATALALGKTTIRFKNGKPSLE